MFILVSIFECFPKPIQLYLNSMQKCSMWGKIIWYLRNKEKGSKWVVARGKLVPLTIIEPIIKPDTLEKWQGEKHT